MYYSTPDSYSIVSALLILFLIFLIIREFWLWYWKIGENTARIKNIDKNLQIIVDFLKEQKNEMENQKNIKNSLDNSQK